MSIDKEAVVVKIYEAGVLCQGCNYRNLEGDGWNEPWERSCDLLDRRNSDYEDCPGFEEAARELEAEAASEVPDVDEEDGSVG